MPDTIIYRPRLIETLITNGRMGSYQSVFQPKNDLELVGTYLWNSHVTGLIYPLICASEVSLRNAIDSALTADMGSFWWRGGRLICKSWRPPPALPPNILQSVRDNFVKASQTFIAERRRRYQQNNATPHHEDVVAKTDFSTWEFLLGSEFLGRGLIWPQHLGTVFAGQWTSTSPAIFLNDVRALVSTVRDYRNRLFHHEPAWKGFGVIGESDALNYLLQKIETIEKLIALIDPEKLRLLEKHGILRGARRACSVAEIRRFQHVRQIHEIGSITDLSALINLCETNNSILDAAIPGLDPVRFCITPR
jgi:hypothetical protein